ncbi:ABC transporter permease [Prauserella cavernicola]|uniref:Transport permease protein n=1 Tax=Prauserella cavernicola TaxID=2800127 RepID=A0A934V863_9PSEU|nr:ABC transporter permease [Prauserella cavernicola]MBK1787975.1 ABC transporter permease [Prauserella cavernicola]
MTQPLQRKTTPLTGFGDGLTIMIRNLLKLKHKPGQIIAELIVPVVMVLLFGYVFGSAIAIENGSSYLEYLMPGLLVMGAVLGALSSLTAIARDNGLGVMDRFRSMPMERWSVPFGQTAATLVIGVVGLVTMSVVGLIFGWRAHNGLVPALGAFGLILLLYYAVSWLGAVLGSLVDNEETAARLMMLALPLVMISNVFVPTGGMPSALRALADWNPVSAAVTACRELFGNPGAPSGDLAWPMANPVPATIGASALILLVCVPLAVYRFQKEAS